MEEASPELHRLRLHGSFQVTEYQTPLTNGVIDYQVSGCLHYDVRKESFTRFDMVAYGDVAKLREDVVGPPKGRTMVASLLFELSRGATPWERTPPYIRVSNGGGEAVYFNTGKNKP